MLVVFDIAVKFLRLALFFGCLYLYLCLRLCSEILTLMSLLLNEEKLYITAKKEIVFNAKIINDLVIA